MAAITKISGTPDSRRDGDTAEQGGAQQAPDFDQPGAGLQRFGGQAASDHQAWQLGQVTPHWQGQPAAALQGVGVQGASEQQGGEHWLTGEADGRVQQPIRTDQALALVP